jgi:hypothetical protein
MPDPQEQQDKPKGVRVFGPDNRYYRFPEGTTKEAAVAFFKKRGISSPESPAPKTTPTTEPKTAQKPASFTEEHPFQAGVTKGFGFDPERIAKAGSTEDQWKELGSQALEKSFPALKDKVKMHQLGRFGGAYAIGKTVEHAIGDPLNIARGFEALASQGVEADKKIWQGLTTKNHNLAWEGLGQWLPIIGGALTGSLEAKPTFPHTVNGGVKTAAETATKLGVDAEKAATVAHRSSSGWLGRMLRNRAVLDQYVDAKGLKIGQDVAKARKAIEDEYGGHAQNIEEQIDKTLPTGVVDATAEAQKVADSLKDLVKTPQNVHPSLAQLLKDAKSTGPGQWSFAKARQFRSAIGRAMGHVEGPQQKVMWQIYDDLSKKLGGVAKKYGLGKEWEHYNTLSSQYHKYYSKIVDDIADAKAGEQVAGALSKYKGLTNRMVQNLSKYGLSAEDVTKYMKFAEKWRRENMSVGRGSLFRMAYGHKGGITAMIAARAAGAGWLPSVGAGALSGYLTTEISNMLRAAKLSPEVIEHILDVTGLPGKMPKGKAVTPQEPAAPGTPQLPLTTGPVGPPGVPPAPVSTPSRPTPPTAGPVPSGKGINIQGVEAGQRVRHPSEDIEAHTREIERLKSIKDKAPAEQQQSIDNQIQTHEELRAQKSGTKPTVTKVPEGQHGKGKLAEQAKAVERITKNRAKAKRGAEAEAAEAQARAQSTGMDVSKLQIPEMEEALQEMEPVAFKALQKGRKAKLFAEQDYEPYLREMLLRAYESRSGSK